MPDMFDNMTDEELRQYLAEKQIREAAMFGQSQNPDFGQGNVQSQPEPVAQSAPEMAPVRPVTNAETGMALPQAQNAFYEQLQRSGEYDPNANWGSYNRPVIMVEGGAPRPGQWYVDLNGQRVQAPGGEQTTDQGLGFMQGVMKPWNAAAGYLESAASNIPGYDAINQWSHDNLGTALTVADAERAQQGYFDEQALNGRIPGAMGRFAGNVVGVAPLALAAPSGLPGALMTGAGSGLLLSDAESTGGKVFDAGLGALTGGALHGAGTFLNQPPIRDAGKRLLSDFGVRLTPGQMLGYPESLVSKVIPFASSAQKQAMDDFGYAAGNYALQPLGVSIPRGVNPSEFMANQIQSAANQAAQAGDRTALQAAQEAASRFGQYRAAGAKGPVTPGSLASAGQNQAMTDFAQTGRNVIGDSYTPGKNFAGFTTAGMLGEGLLANLADDVLQNSTLRLTGNAAKGATALYSPPGRYVARGLLMGERPQAVQSASDLIRGRLGGLFGGSFVDSRYLTPQYYPGIDLGYQGY